MFRNKEVKDFACAFFMWFIFNVLIGCLLDISNVAGLCLATVGYGALFFLFTRSRYLRLSEIAEEIDFILHQSDRVFIGTEEEGELAILENEIAKMTLRIREQNKELRKKKTNLSNALADIAHQLRTPLTAAELILNRLERCHDSATCQKLMREMNVLYQQMDWLLTTLLKLSRLDAGLVPFDKMDVAFQDIVSRVCQQLAITIELHEIHLEQKIQPDMILHLDPVWTTEALQNIVKNSIDHIKDGGTIHICAENTLLFSQIIICDNGPGFNTSDLTHIFERFYQGNNRSNSGFGIGLALSKAIIVRQNGTIKAKNHAKGGAMFVIRFPR